MSNQELCLLCGETIGLHVKHSLHCTGPMLVHPTWTTPSSGMRDGDIVARWEVFVALDTRYGDAGEGDWLSAWQGFVFALGRPDLMPRRQFKMLACAAIWDKND